MCRLAPEKFAATRFHRLVDVLIRNGDRAEEQRGAQPNAVAIKLLAQD
jgi:hypothetical protein